MSIGCGMLQWIYEAKFLDVFGLVLNVIAALLMLSFPMCATTIAQDKKTGKYYLTGDLRSEIAVPWWKVVGAILAPRLLFVGFLLQLIAAYLSR
jgi:hypothetical protein